MVKKILLLLHNYEDFWHEMKNMTKPFSLLQIFKLVIALINKLTHLEHTAKVPVLAARKLNKKIPDS